MLASLETQYNASKNAIPDSPFKDHGHRCRDGGGAGDDRREAGRWTVRAVSVRAEREPGLLGSGGAERDDGRQTPLPGWEASSRS